MHPGGDLPFIFLMNIILEIKLQWYISIQKVSAILHI